jgi:hypothetical protein
VTSRAAIALTAAVAVSAAAVVVSCSSNNGAPAPLPTTSASPETRNALHSCAEATKSLTSAHVNIVLNGKFDRLGQASAVDGDAQASPLVINGTVKYQNGSTAPLVVANDAVSVKQGGVWNDVGATSTLVPPAVIDPRQGLPDLLDGTESPQLSGTETIDAVDTTRVTATIPADKAKDLLPEANGPADLTVWIRKAAPPVLVRALIGLNAQQSIVVTLSNWNTPVQVSATPAS